MNSLIAFATTWGSKHGGVNSFNADLLTAFGAAYHLNAQIICIVGSGTDAAIDEAAKAHVKLITLPYRFDGQVLDPTHGQAAVELLRKLNISFEPEKTVWLGHDRITGAAAIAAAKKAGGRSALIHHMSYDHYESYAEDSHSALVKTQLQTELFQNADVLLAVGPLLRDAASDLVGGSKPVHMVIPGLAEIDSQGAPNTFVGFLSGRWSEDAARIKQGQLGVAAFARAQRDARIDGRPDAFRRQPKLFLRGVDFEDQLGNAPPPDQGDPETELKQLAEEQAGAVVNLHALPFTEDRQQLYLELAKSSVAVMPSWHEGFGLAAWEAIAAGVPLIITKNSGVYRLLEEEYPGAGTGCVFSIEVLGSRVPPFFREQDLETTAARLKEIADNPSKARKQSSILKNLLARHTWAACAEQVSQGFGWVIEKGSVSPLANESPSISFPQSVDIGLSDERDPLRIPVGQWRPGAGMADSQLLRAEEALLPFDPARQPTLDELNAWLDDTAWLQSVRLITGAGGHGKTRLALELCHQRIELGWHAGFLDSSLDANRMEGSWQYLRERDRPILIVVDYAETRQVALLALLRVILKTPGNQPVRMLLLARDGGEWWDNLPSKDSQCDAFLTGYATTGPHRLPSLYAGEDDRRKAYTKALQVFGKALNARPPDIVPELLAEHFARPLYIQMAALLALYGERPTTAQGLTRALLNHERRYWLGLLAHFNWPEPERRAEQLLALTTLAGGFDTPRSAEPCWQEAKGTVLSSGDFHSLFRALSTLYPGTQGLQPLRPDILGEALVAQTLLRPGADTLLDAVLGTHSNHVIRRNALTVLARLSVDRPDLHELLVEAFVRHFPHSCQDIVAVSIQTIGHLPTLTEQAFQRLSSVVKSQSAGLLAPLFREESVQHGTLSCLIAEYLADKSRQKLEKKPRNPDRIAECGSALMVHALHLARIGRYHRAIEIDEEALTLYGRLPATEFQRVEPDYAALLSNFSSDLNEVGVHERALVMADEGLKISKRLAEKNPGRFEPPLAIAMSNYATLLGDVNRYDEALKYASQALEIRKRLAEQNPDRFEPDLATSLNNYASHLSDVGLDEEALEHARRAMELHKLLSEKNPDRFEPELATALENFSNRLSDAGQNEEALEHVLQALEIHKRLSEKNPDRFEPDLAISLSNSSNRLRDAGKNEEALVQARGALKIHKRLSEKSSERFEPVLASSLNNYATHLNGAGQDEEALEHVLQALEILKRLSKKNPDRFEPNLARSFSSYASQLSDVGQNEEALKYAREALEILKRVEERAPRRFADEVYSVSYFIRFLAWLANEQLNPPKAEFVDLLSLISPFRQHLMLLFTSFVEGCVETKSSARSIFFQDVLSHWNHLSGTDKTRAQPYYLCSAAWLNKFDPSAVVTDLSAHWGRYQKQRNDKIPKWMVEVALRLGFEWPMILPRSRP